MKIVIQRVSMASVTVGHKIISKINKGLLVLLGVENADNQEDIDWLVKKVANLRIFDDDNGVMNISVKGAGGDIIVVSQFTLHANVKKGNRPSYIKASNPEIAVPLYKQFVKQLEVALGKPVGTGQFGATMQVSLVNDGPVTILIDSKQRV